MSERKTDDAKIQEVVHFISHTSQKVSLIEMTNTWSDADFLYAIERIQIQQPLGSRDQLRELYWTVRTERQTENARIAFEKVNAQRHTEISRKLEELKTPHWSIVPNFWMTFIILILTGIMTVAAILAVCR